MTDYNRIHRAANSIVALDAGLSDRLASALSELDTLDAGTASEGVSSVITDAKEALETQDPDALRAAAWQVVRLEHEYRE